MIFDGCVFLSVYDHFTAWSVPNKDWGNLPIRNRGYFKSARGSVTNKIYAKFEIEAWITTF